MARRIPQGKSSVEICSQPLKHLVLAFGLSSWPSPKQSAIPPAHFWPSNPYVRNRLCSIERPEPMFAPRNVARDHLPRPFGASHRLVQHHLPLHRIQLRELQELPDLFLPEAMGRGRPSCQGPSQLLRMCLESWFDSGQASPICSAPSPTLGALCLFHRNHFQR